MTLYTGDKNITSSPPRRCIKLRISYEAFPQILTHPGYIKNLPRDAKLIDFYSDRDRQIISLVFVHHTFPEVYEGQEMEELAAEFTEK